jgi:hypothetical protein
MILELTNEETHTLLNRRFRRNVVEPSGGTAAKMGGEPEPGAISRPPSPEPDSGSVRQRRTLGPCSVASTMEARFLQHLSRLLDLPGEECFRDVLTGLAMVFRLHDRFSLRRQ